jgi:hypothetical protein
MAGTSDLDELVAALGRQRGAEFSEAELAAARARAQEIVAEARNNGKDPAELVQGLRDMQNLTISIGLPVPRILFREMVAAARANPGRKKTWGRQLARMSDVQETGCIGVDFFDTQTRAANKAYLVLDACGADHDLGAQLDRLFARVGADKRDELREHLSMLIHLGREAYGHMSVAARPILTEIAKKVPAADGRPLDFLALRVDPANTTLYLDAPGAQRVGIFVRFEDDVDTAFAGAGVDFAAEDAVAEDAAAEDEDEDEVAGADAGDADAAAEDEDEDDGADADGADAGDADAV